MSNRELPIAYIATIFRSKTSKRGLVEISLVSVVCIWSLNADFPVCFYSMLTMCLCADVFLLQLSCKAPQESFRQMGALYQMFAIIINIQIERRFSDIPTSTCRLFALLFTFPRGTLSVCQKGVCVCVRHV